MTANNANELLGTWDASRPDGSKYELTVKKDGTFVWKFSLPKEKTVELTGKYVVEENVLSLERESGGILVGTVTPGASGTIDDKFNFKMIGGPEEDLGLDFTRRQERKTKSTKR